MTLFLFIFHADIHNLSLMKVINHMFQWPGSGSCQQWGAISHLVVPLMALFVKAHGSWCLEGWLNLGSIPTASMNCRWTLNVAHLIPKKKKKHQWFMIVVHDFRRLWFHICSFRPVDGCGRNSSLAHQGMLHFHAHGLATASLFMLISVTFLVEWPMTVKTQMAIYHGVHIYMHLWMSNAKTYILTWMMFICVSMQVFRWLLWAGAAGPVWG